MFVEGPQSGHGDAALERARALVRAIRDLAAFPATATEILRHLADPASSVRDMERTVQRDPALATRLLRVVNSACWGLPVRVGSVQRAISLLGVGVLRDLVVAATLDPFFRGGPAGSGLEPERLWRHSVAAASIARRLAQRSPTAPREEAFLCGLLHDVGVVAILHADRAGGLGVLAHARREHCSFLEAERAHLGTDHTLVGGALCEAWHFPTELQAAARHHHTPEQAPEALQPAAWLALVADRLAAAATDGWDGDLDGTDIPPAAWACLRITPAQAADAAAGPLQDAA